MQISVAIIVAGFLAGVNTVKLISVNGTYEWRGDRTQCFGAN